MLIKGMSKKKKGVPVLHTAEEAAPMAVQRGVSKMNTSQMTYWVLAKSIKIDSCNTNQSAGKSGYSATAKGSAMIGHTLVATDQFYAPSLTHFTVDYHSSTDAKGLPDIAVTSFTPDKLTKNPSDFRQLPKVAPAPVVAVPAPAPKKEEPKLEPKPEPKLEPKLEPKSEPKKEEPKKVEVKKEEPKKDEAKKD